MLFGNVNRLRFIEILSKLLKDTGTNVNNSTFILLLIVFGSPMPSRLIFVREIDLNINRLTLLKCYSDISVTCANTLGTRGYSSYFGTKSLYCKGRKKISLG